ncbi:type II secretion system secretin GspD [Cognatiyoonia sp. IB215446]|uniref:type II secretion system secretin GspD n=1 Tax=Cognatiyoonia sp. IB215446 TaxID=3097355 RepID=UPI002A123EDB|nr:type II secretion system secretin GspD [Cognatiyoonia sp. IB215446]MDX8349129.1 type II secretion system secretin GspD [Cognatiyoonia sp. IB215446]
MKKLIAIAASAAILSACDDLPQVDRAEDGTELNRWQLANIFGTGGDGQGFQRQQGRVTGGQRVEAGQGTIFPGRQPLLIDSDFVDENGERTVSLNLVNVDIESAAAAILGELLQINYVIDPGVQGTVNIRSSQPVTRTTAIEVFELALEQNNAVLVRRGDIFAISPLSADLSIAPSTARDVLPGYTLRVIPLRNIGAQEMAAILQPFAGDGIVGIDAQRNILVLAGTSVDQQSWQETIDSFDVDWLANRSVGIFPINGRSAQSIVNGLERVVETDEGFQPLVVFEVIPENNSILAVAKTPRALENVAVWINRLTRDGANDAQVYSYDMKYARASSIAPTLAQILGVSVETSSEEPAVIEASAEMASGGIFNNQGTLNATRIVASEATNTLLIHATPEEYERVLGILHRLDVPQRQVLVEATIVEVSLTEDLRYGVQYFLEEGGGTLGLTSGENFDISPSAPGFAVTLGGSPANAVIDALDAVTSINVISSPNLMILNNESARLVVGDQVPTAVRTAQDASSADDQVFVSTVEYRDTGVIFEVTPRINSSGSVLLNIGQEVSLVGETDPATGNPVISQRLINSSIAVDSGETVVLGGLFSDRRTRGNGGIPVLKDLPVAGNLFGNSSRNRAQTELLVLITPRIVNNRMDARRVTAQLRDRLQSIQTSSPSMSTQVNVPSTRTRNSELISNNAIVERAVAGATQLETTAPQASGRHLAVLGSFRSAEGAQNHWNTLVSQNGTALGRFTPSFRQSGGLTMVTVGPMSRDAANQICIDVKTDCFTATQ